MFSRRHCASLLIVGLVDALVVQPSRASRIRSLEDPSRLLFGSWLALGEMQSLECAPILTQAIEGTGQRGLLLRQVKALRVEICNARRILSLHGYGSGRS